jgi:uncharacterized protein (DUF2147 family)
MLHRPRNVALMLVCCGSLYGAATGSAAAGDPTGDWLVADRVANIRVAECKGSMWGAVAWEKEPGIDSNNADSTKQGRPTLGMVILMDMKKKPGEDTWEGQVYDAKVTGRLQSATITLIDPNQLKIRGCVLGFMCGGESWTRASGPIPSSPTNGAAKGSKAPAAKAASAPKSTAPTGAPKAGQKTAAGQPADIGDICLLPEIAGLAH